jgi:hypothetical protein
MIMLLISLVQWWYGDGWRQRAQMVGGRLDSTVDYFSIELLLKTLFAPFRQISAGKVDGPLEVKFRAFADRLISRVIGAMVRLVVLVIGIITIFLQSMIGMIILAGWACVPILPIIGVAMMIIGWTP